MCLAYLHLPLEEFNNYTPIEIDYALKAYYENKEEENKLSWEQLRIQTYFNYLLTPSQKPKVSFITFKNDYMPFSFDKDIDDKTSIIDDKMFEEMENLINKKIEGAK
jgi:hypothetical protein